MNLMKVISNYVGNIMLISSSIIFLKIILGSKFKRNMFITFIGVLFNAGIYTVIFYNVEGIFRTLLIIFFNILLLYYVFNIQRDKVVYINLMYSIINIISEILVFFVLVFILKLSNDYCYNVFAGSFLSNFVICMTTILISLCLKKPLKKLTNIKLKENKQIIVFSILISVSVFIFFYDSFTNLQINKRLLINFASIVIFITIMIYFIREKIISNTTSVKYNAMIDFVKDYEVTIDEQRKIKHEMKNQLITIKSKLIDNEKRNKIIEYIDSILKDVKELDKEKYAKLGCLPTNGLKGLFYFKISEAETFGIKLNLSFSKDIKSSCLSNLNATNYKQLCQIIGVFFDNAIDASKISDEKLIGLEIYVIEKNIVNIIISNTYSKKVDIKKIGKANYSTKGKGHGYGLALVQSIVNNCK
ncbi:MAG: GHKL domain-containing protein [bacterium]|nr:GHKL domain-containing protein [bacterium]